jgi:hypothetical protein
MNVRLILLALGCALLAACNYQASTSYSKSTSSSTGANGGSEEHTLTFRSNGFAYELKTNGKLNIKDGALESLADGQYIDLTVTEDGTRHQYRITRNSDGIKTEKNGGDTTAADDDARIKRVLANIDGTASTAATAQASLSQTQSKVIRDQADAVEKQAEALRRQADALQKQADELRKQAGK